MIYDSRNIIQVLSERHPDKALMPKDEATKKLVQEFIEKYYSIQPNITGFTFNQPNLGHEDMLKKPRQIMSGKRQLEKLAKIPEFKEIAINK